VLLFFDRQHITKMLSYFYNKDGGKNMSLIICKECGKEVSDKAGRCPHCGCPIENPLLETQENKKKTKVGIILFAFAFLLICICIFIGVTSQPKNSAGNNVNEGKQNFEKNTEAVKDDFSDVETVYELTAGYYTAGIDIPSGKCNVYAVSGTGNLQSTNMFNGGVNEMFGIDDGNGLFTSSFNGLQLSEGVVLSTNNRMVIRIEYTSINGRAGGRYYDTENSIELSAGNYVSGEDFPAGVYSIEAISGTGNLLSSNIFNGGVNEMFGIDDGNGFYSEHIQNVDLPKDVELEVKGDLIIKLIPSK